jgi:CRISPR/Cas system-associated endonuclease Cas3-HD
MNHYEEILELQRLLEKYLLEINDAILSYPPKGDEEKFEFLIKKAISYRDIIQKIKKESE